MVMQLNQPYTRIDSTTLMLNQYWN